MCNLAPSLPPFLAQHLSPALASAHAHAHDGSPPQPHITLTWAQSLDFKIAGKGGERVIISGEESMMMTHWMRSMHDAILVGINTIVLDDPRLQINLLPQDPSLNLFPPQPLILDPKLRFPLNSRILKAYIDFRDASSSDKEHLPRVVRQPWVICGEGVNEEKKAECGNAGVRVIPVKLDTEGHIPPSSLPDILSSLSLRSVMIEGGSRILSAFLRDSKTALRSDGSVLVDSVIVTVGPIFIGEGIGVIPNAEVQAEEAGLPGLETIHTEAMGKDAVMLCKVKARS